MNTRQLFCLLLACLGLVLPAWSQVPEGITYQAVARDNAGVIKNANIKVQFIIANPTAIYREEHQLTTNQFGLFTAQIGQGVPIPIQGVIRDFADIDWAIASINQSYTIEVQLQFPVGAGNPFDFFGSVELLSVPYSLYSKRAATVDDMPLDSLSNVEITNIQEGQVIRWQAGRWVNGTGGGGGAIYIPGDGISIIGDTLINTGDPDPSDDITTSTVAGGDLSGTYPNPEVEGILGREISRAASLDSGFVLKWMPDSNRWMPMPDETLSVTGGGLVNVTPRLEGNGSAGSRLDIAQQGATTGQVLKWNGGSWSPANDSTHTYYNEVSGSVLLLFKDSVLVDSDVLPGTQYTAGAGIDILGNSIIVNTGDINANDDVLLTTPAPTPGDISGSFGTTFTVNRIKNIDVSYPLGVPNGGDVLKFDQATFRWVAEPDATQDADPDPGNELQVLTKTDTFNLELSLTGSTVELPRYVSGSGINVTPLSNAAFSISNTGDLDPDDDITIGTGAGGDLGNTYPDPRVEGIWNRSIVNTTPNPGEAYLWFDTPSGGEWRPAKPTDDDADPTNEIQRLTADPDVRQLYLSLSNDTINIPQLTAGPGIDLTNRIITNTGDLNPNDDITTSTQAAGDLIGFFPSLTVKGFWGRDIDNSVVPTNGQVLKWVQGPPSAWVYQDDAVDDADSDPENEFQSLALSGDTLSISNRNSVVLRDNDPTNEFQNLSLDEDQLSLSNSPDTISLGAFLKEGEAVGGDLADTLPNPRVVGIQNIPVSVAGLQPQQVLKYTGTTWRPANDLFEDADSDPVNEIQDLDLRGNDLTLSQSTIAISLEDFIRENELAGGDLADSFPNPTVIAIQNQAVTDNIPLNNQILKWDDIQGEYVLTNDEVNDADNDSTNERQDLIWDNTARTLTLTQSSQVVTIPDNVDDNDADPTNEIQTLSAEGDTAFSLTNGGRIEFPEYFPGTGIDIINRVIFNTGDTDGTDDLTIGATAGGDLAGTYPNPTVEGILGQDISNAPLQAGQILKYDGAQWALTQDLFEDGDADDQNELQSLRIKDDTLILSNPTGNDTVVLAPSIQPGENAGGDLSGTYPNPTVSGIGSIPVDLTGIAANATLKYDGSSWAISSDEVDDADADATNELQTISKAGNTVTLSNGGGAFIDEIEDADADSTNEIQTITKAGNTVTLSDGGGSFIDEVNDADADSTNEFQTIAKAGNTVTLSDGGGSFTDEVNDADADSTNEFQTITKAGNTVTLSDGGGSFIDEVNDADADSTNEFQTLTKVGNTVTLSDGGGSFTDEINDADADSTNEFQTITKAGNTVTLSDGGGSFIDEVNDADADSTNEFQTITKSGTLVTLSNGGGSFVDETADADADPLNEIQSLSRSGQTILLSGGGGSFLDQIDDADADPTNEIQSLSRSGDTVFLSNGGGFFIDGGIGEDSDSTNEIQVLSKLGNVVTLSKGGGSFTDEVDDADASPNNELQTITKSGTVVTLSNGGGSFVDETADADANPINELQTISKAGSTVTLSNGGGSFTDEIDDADADPSNEFQTIAKAGNTVTLSDGGGSFTDEVDDADADSTNELQTLSRLGNTITLSDGGGSFTDETADADSDSTNEIQVLSKLGNTVSLSNGGGSFVDAVDDADADSTNEIQTISYAAGILTLSDGGGAVSLPGVNYDGGPGISIIGSVISNTGDTLATDDITITSAAGGDVSGTFSNLTVEGLQGRAVSSGAPAANEVLKFRNGNWSPEADSVDDADADPTNEIQSLSLMGDSLGISGVSGKIFLSDNDDTNEIQTISKSGALVTLSDGGGAFIDATDDADADPLNEIQTISKLSNVVILSNGGGSYIDETDDADADPTNEIQTLILAGDSLEITGGNKIGLTDIDSLNEIQTLTKSGLTVTLSNGGGSFTDSVGDADADPLNEIQSISKSGLTVTLSNGGGSFTDSVGDADADPTNEIQTVSRSGLIVTLSNGGGTFVDSVGDADADPGNEIQSISRNGLLISLSNGGGSIIDSIEDADANPTNELQSISRSGLTVTLSNGGGSFTDSVGDADADPANELQTISKSGLTITLSNGGGTFTDSVGDADADPANELQTISRTGTIVTLSNGGGTFADSVADADADPLNEIQTLSFSNDTLSLSGDATRIALDTFLTMNEPIAGGDLSSTYGAPTVAAIQGNAVLAGTPDNGEVLTYNTSNTQWEPDSVRSSRMLFDSDVIPTAGGFDLGSTVNRWDSLFLVNPTNIVSDMRFKTDIQDMKYGIEEIMQLRPVSYRLDQPGTAAQLGLLAQEVEPVIGEVVTKHSSLTHPLTGDSLASGYYYGMSYGELIPVLVKGMQDQQNQIQEQQELIEQQQQLLQAMEARLKQLEVQSLDEDK